MNEWAEWTITPDEMDAALALMQAWRELNKALNENDVVKWLGAMQIIEKHIETRIGTTISKVMTGIE